MLFARRVCLAVALLLVVAGGQVYAQTDTGSIDGRVFDEQKAAMPGVTVTAKNTATGFIRTATTGGTGTYHIEALPPGTYDVSAEIEGSRPSSARASGSKSRPPRSSTSPCGSATSRKPSR